MTSNSSNGYGYPMQAAAAPKPKRRKRIFLWVFLGIQVVFIIWIIVGVAGTSHSGADAHVQALAYCKTSWQGLYPSQSACVTQYGNLLSDASSAGKGIGVGLIIGLWVAADVVLGIGRLVVLTARRHHS